MQTKIHPKWYPDCRVTCSCGNSILVGSTKAEFQIEVCSRCHPFYTGEMRFVDSEGRVERFKQKRKKAQTLRVQLEEKKKLKKTKKKQDDSPKTLKEMLFQSKLEK